MNRLVTAFLVISLTTAAGCGTNNENNTTTNNATSNNTTSNNTTPNNTTSNNTTSNNTTSNNTSPNNTGNNNPRTEPYVSQLRFYEETQSPLGATKEGFTIGILGETIENEDGNQGRISEMEVEAFENAHLTASTIEAMKTGWGCREVTTGADMGATADMGVSDMGTSDAGTGTLEDSTYWFEARIREDGDTRYIQEITGCVLDGDPDVLAIIEDLNALAESYL